MLLSLSMVAILFSLRSNATVMLSLSALVKITFRLFFINNLQDFINSDIFELIELVGDRKENKLFITGIALFLIHNCVLVLNFFVLFSKFLMNSNTALLVLTTGTEKFPPSCNKHCISCGIVVFAKLMNQNLFYGKKRKFYFY